MLRRAYVLTGNTIDNLGIDTLWAAMRSSETPYLSCDGRLGILSNIERESGNGRTFNLYLHDENHQCFSHYVQVVQAAKLVEIRVA